MTDKCGTGGLALPLMFLTCACTATSGHELIAHDVVTKHGLSSEPVFGILGLEGEVDLVSGLPDERLLAVSSAIPASAFPASAFPAGGLGQASDEKWQFDVALYLWAANVSGAVATQSGLGVPIDQSFSDALKSFDVGGMVYHEGRKGQWGYQIDLIYADLESESPGVTGDIDVGVKAFVGEADVTFSPRDAPSLQYLLGARVISIEQSVALPIGPSEEGDETLVDPVVGAQGVWDFADRWKFRLRGDVGGFGVGSELTYQALGVFGWEFAKDWSLDFGYRLLGYDIKKGDVNLDMQMHGALVGVAWSF